jgi:hypothetical protein
MGELGLGSSGTNNQLSVVCKTAGQNAFSLYGTGTLGVDGSKNPVWTAPSSNYRLGDFRGYNHTASTPSASNNFTHNWGPGGASTDISIATLPQNFNLFYCDSGATRIYYKAYLSTSNRTSEVSPWDTQLSTVLTSSITPPSGHTRAARTTKPQHPHVQTFNSFVTTGLSTPNDYIYLDTFFATVGGSRAVNLGTLSGGYTTITMHEQQQPYITASGTAPTPSGGYTAAFPVVHNVSSYCSTTSQLGQTFASTTAVFYIKVHAIYGSSTRSMYCSSATVTLQHDGGTQTVWTGSIPTNGRYISVTMSGGNSWSYDEVGYARVTSATYSGSYYTC